MKRSLCNKKILVTREASQATEFSQLIRERQGIPIEIPLIKVTCRKQLEQPLKFDQWKWIFFTSQHGVRCFFQHTKKESLSHVQFATVGSKTEQKLMEYGYQSSFIPSVYDATTMAEEFLQQFPNANDILLVRGNISRKTLVDVFNEKELRFHPVVVYDTVPNLEAKQSLKRLLQHNTPDILTFTSPSTVDTFVTLLRDDERFSFVFSLPIVCIGTTTEKRAIEKGFSQTIVPKTFTIESMIEKMCDYIQMEGK